MTSLTHPADISRFRLISLRGGVRLEAKGMRKHGRQCKAIVIQEFGLPRNATHEEVIEFLTQRIEGKHETR